jgi:iron complex outermembrane receptor protein
MRNPLRSPVRLVLAALAAALAAPAGAQVLEDIVVTAQKREENLQDVGIAITAFTGDQMRELGVRESFDVAAFTPGVHISGNLAGQNTQFTIRGVTQNDFADIVESPNAVYVDEGYIPVAQAQTFGVFDIERVEILKGPQGTLFGRNATGGLVHYITRKPNMDNWEGFADAQYGVYDSENDPNSLRLEGAFGGPITSTLGVRVSALLIDQDPYLNNRYQEDASTNNQFIFGAGTFGGDNSFQANNPGFGAGADMGDNETTAARATLQFEPSEDLRFTWSNQFADTDVATGPYQSKPTTAVFGGPGNAADPTQLYPESIGEIVNVINTPTSGVAAGLRSICSDGVTDCGSDQDNDGFPDDLDGNPGLDILRLDNNFNPTTGTDFFGYRDPDGEGWDTYGDFAFKDQGSTDTWGTQLRAEWDFADGYDFVSITDYKEYEKLLFIDVDSAPVNQLANYGSLDNESFTQEFRVNGTFDRWRWVAGFYYLYIDAKVNNGLKIPTRSVASGGSPFGPIGFDVNSASTLETNSTSLFGQIEYDLTDQWTLIGGLRGIREEKEYEFTQGLFPSPSSNKVRQGSPIIIGPTPTGGYSQNDDNNLWAGTAQVNWKPNDDWLVYGGVRRGVKAGSFNMALNGGLPVPVNDIPYDEEILTAYEGGFKSTWFGGTTRLNASVYYYDYEDYQAFLFTGVGGIVINADAEYVGGELEIQTSPIEGLDLLLNASYIDAEVQDVPFRADYAGQTSQPIVDDVEPVYTPEWQVSGIARYEWSMFGGLARVQGDFSYSDSFYYNLRNFDADEFDSYTLYNALIGWGTESGTWDFALEFRNITDENAGIQGFDLATLCGCNEESWRAPRWWGFSARYAFGAE